MAYYRNLLDGSVSQLEKENRQIAYQAALEGIVLLQNDSVRDPLHSPDEMREYPKQVTELDV